ncbi:helix-turn-helix domain-containing protein [Romboutsia sp. 1001713B170207_170306_H8]|uniref:helix-turn-helix domain-containing protein n=1 Tax=Romboutsia sp. 1001713B170207_170306_H8 TaxID=2787112 RepID=UPI001899626E|nr:helix-turn-helix domain-containing protein [Romboutsia sp. 1001713B170207_170306_H8]
MKSIGNKVKELREERDIPSQDLAAHLGISPSTLSNWEKGRRNIDNDNIVKIAQYFNVTTDFLLNNEKVIKKESSKEANQEKDIEKMIDELMNQQGLMLCGEPMSEQDMILLRNSIRSTIEMAKNMKNKK